MSYKENAHANKLYHHGYSQKKMKISIRMVLVLQWVLAICALSSRDWLPPGYQWCQFSVIGLGVWSIIERDSVEAVFLYTVGTSISVIIDIIFVWASFATGKNDAKELDRMGMFNFSAAAVIIHIMVKPIQIIIIHQIYKDRGGEYGFNFQHVLPGSGRYENIDDEAESFQSNTYKPMSNIQQKAVPTYQS